MLYIWTRDKIDKQNSNPKQSNYVMLIDGKFSSEKTEKFTSGHVMSVLGKSSVVAHGLQGQWSEPLESSDLLHLHPHLSSWLTGSNLPGIALNSFSYPGLLP